MEAFIIIILIILTCAALYRISGQKRELEYLKLQLADMAKRLNVFSRELQALRQQVSEYTMTGEKTERFTPEQRLHEPSESQKKEASAPRVAETPLFQAGNAKLESALEQPDIVMEPPFVSEISQDMAAATQSRNAQMPENAPAATSPQWLEQFLAWCVGGNPLARVGILILFFGVSFILKLAADHGFFPLELRLSCVALGAAALLGVGWRLRDKRRNYGLLLQGGGVGILYLVIYAAFAYYKLIPQESALFVFILLFAICLLSSFLAVRQDAPALAVMGMTGGFAAPVLISTGSGNHIALFSYFALLNAGVLGIAWFRAWRALNLLGFAFTLGVGYIWGAKYYTPECLRSVEFFLVLFFLYYVAVALLYAMRRELELKRYVDGTLVFGAPIAFSMLQARIVGEIEFGMAWSAAALGALYLLLATWLARIRLERLRLFFEAMLALGVLFLTLAVPLAFEGTRLTGAIWAVEGAGLCWIAVRQRHMTALASGLILQAFAAVSFFFDPSAGAIPEAPLALNSWYIGAMMLTLSSLFCGWRLNSGAARSWLGASGQNLSILLGCIGLLWWLGSGSAEILRYFGQFTTASYAYLLFAVMTAWLAHGVNRHLRWADMEWPALALSPALLFAALLSLSLDLKPLAGWGLYAWPSAAILAYTLLFQQERHATRLLFPKKILGTLHALMFWTLCLVAGMEFNNFVARHVPEGVWQLSSHAFVRSLLLLALIHIAPRFDWPVARFRSYYLTLGAAPVVLMISGWAFLGLGSDGNPEPLPYLPLLNPVELCQLLVFVTLFSWGRANKESFAALSRVRTIFAASQKWLTAGAAVLLFLLLNAMLLRTLHYWLEIPYRFDALYDSTTAQAALSLLWSLMALILMVWAVRRAQRAPWFTGITLLILTVCKLFFVELSNIGGTARIFSFIGVGLLLLLIGYLAPLPPKKKWQD